MIRRPVRVSVLLALALPCLPACSNDAPARASTGPTTEVDSLGVTVVRHGPTAFDDAAQWTVDPEPVVVYSGGTEPDFDLTWAFRPIRFPDGRVALLNRMGGGRLMLFDASGRPERVLGRTGNGPGELVAPQEPILLGGDTIAVVEEANNRLNFYTPSAGFIHSEPLETSRAVSCLQPEGMLPGRRIVGLARCFGKPEPGRHPFAVVAVNLDRSDPDTVAMLPGIEFVEFEVNYGRGPTADARPKRFTLDAHATAWDSSIVTATGEGGYVIERRDRTGRVQMRIIAAVPRRVVTQAMRDRRIAEELERVPQMEGGTMQRAELERIAREVPFADSLPPYQRLNAVPGGPLWVTDGQASSDTAWWATAFNRDGTIAARLSSSRPGMPLWFGGDQVIVREVDDDGVVTYGTYRIRRGR